MSAVESLALVLLDMVVAVLALGGGQAEGFHLRLELLDATDTGQVAVQLGGHVAGLQKLGIKIQRGCQVLVALQSVLLVITKRKKEIFKTMLKKFVKETYASAAKKLFFGAISVVMISGARRSCSSSLDASATCLCSSSWNKIKEAYCRLMGVVRPYSWLFQNRSSSSLKLITEGS